MEIPCLYSNAGRKTITTMEVPDDIAAVMRLLGEIHACIVSTPTYPGLYAYCDVYDKETRRYILSCPPVRIEALVMVLQAWRDAGCPTVRTIGEGIDRMSEWGIDKGILRPDYQREFV